MESFGNKCKGLLSSRGCFGCCYRPATTIPVGNRSNRLRNQEQTAKQESISDELWGTSLVEMDCNGLQSQQSLSSIGMMNQSVDSLTCAAASTSNSPEFVNHGFLLWKQTRQQWLANKNSCNKKLLREPTISWNATPLPDMVDFLVDIWEQDGLYD